MNCATISLFLFLLLLLFLLLRHSLVNFRRSRKDLRESREDRKVRMT